MHTALDAAIGEVSLQQVVADAPPADPSRRDEGSLAFDSACRVYRIVPERGQVERSFWRPGGATQHQPVDLFVARPPTGGGEFASTDPVSAPLDTPVALAIDANDRLFVLERGRQRVLVYDLVHERLLRRVSLRDVTLATAVDLAGSERTVWVLTDAPGTLVHLEAMRGPSRAHVDLPAALGAARPSALAVAPDGARFILHDGGTDDATVWSPDRASIGIIPARHGTDLAFERDGTLVVARSPDASFLRFRIDEAGWNALPPGTGFGYDGRGIVEAPTGAVGYWSAQGFRVSIPSPARYVAEGSVSTFQLDAHDYQTAWGRLFLDACVPEGTAIQVRCFATDEMPPGASLAASPPADGARPVRWPERTPPLLPVLFDREHQRSPAWQHVHRRGEGGELPWAPPLPDGYVTYEAPIDAPPGRYLWVLLQLTGNGRRTPRLRCLRAEHPGHALLRLLPALYSRDAEMASFLQRYMAPAEGLLSLLGDRADLRRALLDPRGVPEAFLPWLAGFVGLVLDPRLAAERRRALVGEAVCLFRLRGTVWGLTRFVELCTARPVVILEHFKVRGLAGALGGDGSTFTSRAVLGSGFRVGGDLDPREHPIDSTMQELTEQNAHRFTVVIVGALSADELAIAKQALEEHRPAHTEYTLCVVEGASRLGDGMHLGINTVVGRGGSFVPAVLDASALDRAATLGRPEPGARAGEATLGRGARVG